MRQKLHPAPLALAVLAPAYYLVPWERLGAVTEALGFPFWLLFAVIVPGRILKARLSPERRDVLGDAAETVLLGIAFLLLLAFVWALSGISLHHFEMLVPLPLLALAAVDLALPRPDRERGAWVAASSRLAMAGFAVILVAVFLLVLRSGPPVDFTKDTIDHIGYVREIGESGRAFPTDAFYLDAGRDGGDIRKGLLHQVYGYASAYLGIDSFRFLTLVDACWSVVFLLAIYAVAFRFFGDARVAALSPLVYLLGLSDGLSAVTMRESFYANRFGIVFFFFFVAEALQHLQRGTRRSLGLGALWAFAACATHVFYAVLIPLAGVTVLLWKVCFPGRSFRQHAWAVGRVGLASAASIGPYIVFRLMRDYPEANELHAVVQGVVFITDRLYVAEPIRLLRWFGPIGLVTALAIPVMWRRRAEQNGLGYIFACYFTIPLVLFNPVLLPILRDRLTYLVFRLNVFCPYYMLSAAFLVHAATHFRGPGRISLASRLVALALVAAIVVGVAPLVTQNPFSAAQRERERESSPFLWMDGLEFLAGLPERSVIASDPLTSYAVPAFTPQHVVCALDQHVPPNDTRLEERIQAARDILSPFVGMNRTLERIAEHRATHVVVNNRVPPRMLLEYWTMDPALASLSVGKFAARPDAFERVYDENGFVVFEVRKSAAGSDAVTGSPDTVAANPYRLDALPDDFVRVASPAGVATIEGVSLSADAVELGGSIDLEIVWSSERPHGLANYIVSVRFDHAKPGTVHGAWLFPKIARKLKEMSTGERYRFRSDHKVMNGLLGPDTWNPGDLILDRTTIRIPRDLAPGSYTISAKMHTMPHHPNHYLRDFFYDDDTYQGIPIGEIRVR